MGQLKQIAKVCQLQMSHPGAGVASHEGTHPKAGDAAEAGAEADQAGNKGNACPTYCGTCSAPLAS